MRKSVLLLFTVFSLIGCSTAQQKDAISTVELKELLSKDQIQLVDVRTPQEYKEGFIKPAKLVNYFSADFVSQITKNYSKEKPIYLYCRTGNRSGQAAVLLKKEGFNAINVIGGYNQWKNENKNE